MQTNLGGPLSESGACSGSGPGSGPGTNPGPGPGSGLGTGVGAGIGTGTDAGISPGVSPGISPGIIAAYAYAARYIYNDMVVQNDNFLRLTASDDVNQTPLTASVLTSPVCRTVRFDDAFGNVTHRARITTHHREMVLMAIGVVRFENPREYPREYPGEMPLASQTFDATLEQYLTPTPLVHPDRVAHHARVIAGPNPGVVEAVEKITAWVYGNIQYVRASTTVATTAEEVLERGVGVCQDMAHLAMGMMKALGIPSRYVCGLLTTEVGETHAWLEFWHPQLGWLPSDPTRGQAVADPTGLIKFAVGRDYTEAAPVVGSFVSRGTGHLEVAMAQVRFDRDSVTFDDALALIPVLDEPD